MTWTVLQLELRRSRGLAGWLSVVVLLYGGFIAAFYPVIRDNMQAFEQYMQIFPKQFLAAFGMVGSLADPGVFFNMYLGSILWPIVAAIAAGLLGTRAVAVDLDRGFLELALATRVGRAPYLLAAIGGQIVVLAALSLATVAGVIVVGAVVNAGFDASRFLLSVPMLFAFACALAGVATLLSVLSLRRGLSAGLIAGVLLLMYILEAVSQFGTDFDWLGVISAFRYLRSSITIDQGILPLGSLALFAAVAAASWLLAVGAFRRRDLVV